jgi:hypothetical protein
MRIRFVALAVIGSVVMALAPSAVAHHGAAGLFDETRTVELKGVVKTWSFVNPHPILVLEVTDENGQAAEWDVYFGPSAATALRSRGYTAETFEFGETVIVEGHPAAIEGVNGVDVLGGASRVTREDGTPVP